MEHDKPTDSWPAPADITASIAGWMLSARWHQGEEGTLRAEGCLDVTNWARHCDGGQEAETARVIWMVIGDGRAEYNVPLVVSRSAGEQELSGSPEGPGAVAAMGDYLIYDATEHPLGQRTLLALLASGETGDATPPSTQPNGSGDSGPLPMEQLRVLGQAVHGPLGRVSSARKLTSEQSNTSVIYRFDDHPPVILKIFRVLAPGHNPDVELQQALDVTGTVPRQYGSVRMEWKSDGEKRGADVVVAAEFLEGAHDAWQVITERLSASDGTLGYMEDSIRSLGVLTREVHNELSRDFPTVEATPQRRATLRQSWSTRARTAMELVPDVEAYEGSIETIYSATEHVDWPRLQRIHGDYHLGQVLESPGRGWYALDFEGEPLRPLEERTREDLALRDVAGMLRSFDYAAGAAQLAGGDEARVQAWATAAKKAFLDGYGELGDEETILLEALVLDKALYEVVYEATERPDWLAIPLAGISRLASAG
ncbi:hypothetical protein VR010_14270 [Actinomycetaceae bacterium L2_0104]